jgi:hypothetical protein
MVALVYFFTPLRALGRSTSHFLPCKIDPRVRFEPGTERLADHVAAALPEAIAAVERQHYRTFLKPISVFVCATPESLASYGGTKTAGGFVFNGRLFISSKPQNTAERIPRLLTHELSHLHLEQYSGMLGGAWGIPSWFKEGLAVLVGDGGGAETVSESEARGAIVAGNSFEPPLRGRPLFDRSGRSYGLAEHMWYRQSELLVRFMRERDEAAFRRLLDMLLDGKSLGAAVDLAYPEGLDAVVREFRTDVAQKVSTAKSASKD